MMGVMKREDVNDYDGVGHQSQNDEAYIKVTVEGCKAKVSREEASAILAETDQLTEGPERDRFPKYLRNKFDALKVLIT